MWLICLLAIPLLSAILLALLTARPIAGILNLIASFLSFLIVLKLAFHIMHQGAGIIVNGWFYLDYLNVFFMLITAFIGLSTAIYNIPYLVNEQKSRKLNRKKLRYYYSLYQLFFFAAFLILATNNLGILWAAMESATLITVILVGLYHKPQSFEAAWKYLILCGFGLAQALLGTILFYVAAENISGTHNMLLWTELASVSHQLSPQMITIAFIFIIIGYGTKAGFVPLHNWLPDVYGESIAPVLSLLSGVLLNLAFYAILRFKLLADGATGSLFSQKLLLTFGLANIIIAAFFLLRQKELKRLLAYSSIEHMGLISFAFGLGTPLAIYAGLFHILVHALAKSAAFFSAGLAMQIRQSSFIADIKGLNYDFPLLGWGLLLSTLALLGLPPMALFTSEFLLLWSTMKTHPSLMIPLIIGLGIAFAALFFQIQKMAFEKPEQTQNPKTFSLSLLPIYTHLFLIIGLGILIPVCWLQWGEQITLILRGLVG